MLNLDQARLQRVLDAAEPSLDQLATFLRQYYETNLRKGFSPDEALRLTVSLQDALLQALLDL